MPCVAPIVVVHPETKLRSEVGCGQCRACRLRRKLTWVGRLTMEARYHNAARFITLTYADDPGILDYRDFQLFMKRYRKENGDARFFACGEYGGKSGRGHYHAIIFGQMPESRGFAPGLQKLWALGYCYDGTVTKDSIGYVSGYVFKENYTATKKPFVRMSRNPGIGMVGIEQLGKRVGESGIRLSHWPGSFTIGAKSYPLCDGGLAKFQCAYLEAGGLPPPISNPISRDLRARARVHDKLGRGGTQLQLEHDASLALHLRVEDPFGTKKER